MSAGLLSSVGKKVGKSLREAEGSDRQCEVDLQIFYNLPNIMFYSLSSMPIIRSLPFLCELWPPTGRLSCQVTASYTRGHRLGLRLRSSQAAGRNQSLNSWIRPCLAATDAAAAATCGSGGVREALREIKLTLNMSVTKSNYFARAESREHSRDVYVRTPNVV